MNPVNSATSYELSRAFTVSPEALFDALTSAAILKRIWGVQEIDVDAREGGRAVATYVVGDQDWSFTLSYAELVRTEGRLRWVTRFKSFPSKETRVSVKLARVDGGATLTLRMENFESAEECNANRQAWERALAILADVVREQIEN
jgi:uncharacterized protein YndB with AHSA1/START domain